MTARPPGRPRVLFLAPLPPPVTGQAAACATLLADLVTFADVDVIDLMKGHHRQGFTSLAHALKVLRFAWAVFRRAPRADVVYLIPSQTVVGNLKDMLLLTMAGRQCSKVVLHLHGGGIRNTVYLRSRLLWRANRRLLGGIRAAVVLGDSLRPVFAGLVPENRVRVVKNFAADDLFLPPEQIAARFDADPLEVLFLSNLHVEKGYPELLEVAERFAAEHDDRIRFRLAGDCVTVRQRRTVLERIGRLPNVDYLGTVTGAERRRLLAGSHVLCLPTWYPYEGQPLCILEAYAAGCAVLTTNHAGIADVFVDGVNGYRVEPRSVGSLACALDRCLADRPALARIGLANRECAEKYRVSAFLANMRAVLFDHDP